MLLLEFEGEIEFIVVPAATLRNPEVETDLALLLLLFDPFALFGVILEEFPLPIGVILFADEEELLLLLLL